MQNFEILNEEISEDGNTAIVKIKKIYRNGSEKENKMIKVDGKWLNGYGKIT